MAPSAAPWRGLFLASFEKSRVSTFNLTTIAHAPSKRPVPRSRTVEFRGFWPKPASTLHKSGIEALKTQDIGLNPDVYESDLLSVTTDARMGKVGQLADSDDVVEGVFWFEEVSAQWRVRGRAVTIGAPEEDDEERQVREMVKKGMREKKGDGEGNIKDWDWERQVATYFANHSPVMRGTFKNPPPGRPRSEAPSDPQLKLGQKIEDLKDPIARANFRVLLILPQEMEVLDFSNPDDVRRTRWTLANRDEGKWKETELWP